MTTADSIDRTWVLRRPLQELYQREKDSLEASAPDQFLSLLTFQATHRSISSIPVKDDTVAENWDKN